MNRSARWVLGALLSSLLALEMSAAATPGLWEPPPSDEGSPFESTGSTDLLPTLDLAGLQVILEKTTFAEARRQLRGTLGRKAQAGGTLQWLCYSQRHSSLPWVIWLLGDALGADRISGFRWQYVPRALPIDTRCADLPASGTVELPVPLTLGATRADALSALGKPSGIQVNALYYNHERIFFRQKVLWTTLSLAVVSLQRDRVDSISLLRSTTD